MQTLGYMWLNGEKVLILARRTSLGNALKVRNSGHDGQHFEDEEAYLNEHWWMIIRLNMGEVIYL